MSNSQMMNDIMADVAKIGTMMVVSRALMMSVDSTISMTDQQWMMSSLFTLIGFSAYHALTKRFVSTAGQSNPAIRAIHDDLLYFGTMSVVVRLLNRQSLTDMNWLRSTAFTLIGFVMYRVLVQPLVPNIGQSPTTRAVVHDSMQFGTMFVVSQFLSGGQLNMRWAQSSLATLAGFAAYELVSNRM